MQVLRRMARQGAWYVVAVACIAIFIGCGDDDGAAPTASAAEPLSAQARRVHENGLPTERSTIEVRFNRSVEVGEDDLAGAFRVDAGDAPGLPSVTILSASVSATTSRVVLLETDALVSDGAELTVDLAAFGASERGARTVTIAGDLPPIAVVLASGPLEFSDPTVLDASANAPVLDEHRDGSAMREVLESHMRGRGAAEDTVEGALNAYDTMDVDIVTSPKLRAALAALTGTFAEPAIESLLGGENCTGEPAGLVAFQPPPDLPDLLARVTRDSEGRRVLSIHPDIEGEQLELLMPILAHEAIHCDDTDGIVEEIGATALDTFLFMLLLGIDPTLIEPPTRLSRDMTIGLAAFINSGQAVPESVGVLESPGFEGVLPRSTWDTASFAEHVARAYPGITEFDSPPEQTANAYAERLAQIAGMQPGNPFDLAYLDELLGRAMPPEAILAAITALGLQPP